MSIESIETKEIEIFCEAISDDDHESSQKIKVSILENEHVSFFLTDENDGYFFIEEMHISIARKLRDFLNYAVKD